MPTVFRAHYYLLPFPLPRTRSISMDQILAALVSFPQSLGSSFTEGKLALILSSKQVRSTMLDQVANRLYCYNS